MASKVTVKTLDGRDVPFELGEEDKIEDLKKAIEREMNIVIGRQRIIFHGRVLNDDESVAGLGLNGQVVHLVERKACPPQPPRSSGEQQPTQQTRPEARGDAERNRLYAGTIVLSMPPMSLEEVQNTVRRVLEQYGEIGQGINFTALEHSDPRRYELSVTLDGNMLTIDSPAFERIIYLQNTIRFMRNLFEQIEAFRRAIPSQGADLQQPSQSASAGRSDTSGERVPDGQNSKDMDTAVSPQFPPLESFSSQSRIHYIGHYRTRNAIQSDLYNVTQQILDLHRRLQPSIETMLGLLPTHESLSAPGVIPYIDQVQRALHLYSHQLHVLTDLRMSPERGLRNIVYPLVADRELAVRWANVSIVLGDGRRSPVPPPTESSQAGVQSGGETGGTAPTVSAGHANARNAGSSEESSSEQRPPAGVGSTNLPPPTRSTTMRPRAIHNFLENIMSAIVGRRSSGGPEEGSASTGTAGDSRTGETQRRRRSGAEHISRHFNFLGPATIAHVPASDPRVARRPAGAFTAITPDVFNNVFNAGRAGREGRGHQADMFDFGRSHHGREAFLDCSSPHALLPPYEQDSQTSNIRPGMRGRTDSGEATASDALEASLDHIFRVIIDSMLYNMQSRPEDPGAAGPVRTLIRGEPTFYSVSFNATVQEVPEGGEGDADSRAPPTNVQSVPAGMGRFILSNQRGATMAPLESPSMYTTESLVNLLRCVVFMSFFGGRGQTHEQGIFSTILYALGSVGLEELATGNFRALDQRRESVRRYIVDNVLNGAEPTASQIISAAMGLRTDLGCIRQAILCRSACDGTSDLMHLDRQELVQTEKILRFCLTHRSNEGFGRGLYEALSSAMFELFKLIVVSESNGERFGTVPPEELNVRINNFFQMYCHDPVEIIVNSFRESARRFLAAYAPASEHYVVMSNQGNIDVDMASPADSEQGSAHSQSNETNQTQESSVHKRNIKPDAPPVINKVESDPGAMMFHIHDELPPPLISVVEEDIRRQQGMPPQPPFTDAYISGMPAKRRRVEVVEENRPHLADNASDLLREALRRSMSEMYEGVVTTAQGDTIDEAVASDGLSDVLQEFVRERIQRRLRFDQDFDRLRFPFSDKYFKP